MLPLCLIALIVSSAQVYAARSSTIPEDVDAFPKYKIQFLNGRPVLNVTASRWLHDGTITEDEFLGLHKSRTSSHASVKGIGGGREDELATAANAAPSSLAQSPALQQMRLGSSNYLCLLLPPPELPVLPEDTQQAPQPIHTWELLSPLEGSCLYHRQGWFSYAYCHGQHVRQFREKEPQVPLGMGLPVEDPNEPSYMLGHAPAPAHHDDDSDVSIPDQNALANRLELARGAGHRYLNLHWGDGTVCDKTGRKREIEVQFHCSMTTTDSIFFIKETRTCAYTLVIHTPRLCGEPGFKSPREDLQDTPLRCRKVVDTLEGTDPTLPDSTLPFQRREPKPLPAPREKPGSGTKVPETLMENKDPRSRMLQAALDALLGRNAKKGNAGAEKEKGGDHSLEGLVAVSVDEDGELKIEKLSGDTANQLVNAAGVGEGDDGEVMEIELAGGEDATRLLRILREAGYDAILPREDGKKEDDEDLKSHDEL